MNWISDPFGFWLRKKTGFWERNSIQKCCLWEFSKSFLWIDVLIKRGIWIFQEHPKASIRCLSPVPSSQKHFQYVEKPHRKPHYFIWHSWKKRLRYYSIFSQQINVSVMVTDSISINVVHCRVDFGIIEMLTCLFSIFNSILNPDLNIFFLWKAFDSRAISIENDKQIKMDNLIWLALSK